MKVGWNQSCAVIFFVCGFASGARGDALDTWYVRPSGGSSQHFIAAAYGNSNFVVVGYNGVMRSSSNGLDWVSRNSGQSGAMLGATFGNGTFLAASDAGNTNVVVSTNGASWLAFSPNNKATFWGASYAGGAYFLVGSSATIMTATSIDLNCVGGLTNCGWSLTNRVAGSNSDLGGAAYGNGIYVVAGFKVSMTSTNAVTWTSNPTSADLYDVAFGHGIFVAVGIGGVWTSADGVVWTRRYTINQYLVRITFANGTFVAVGSQGTVLTSFDGISWKKRTVPTFAYLVGVTFGNGTFVATGQSGTILQSAPVSIPSLTASRHPSSGGIALTLAGEIGRGYQIQVSTNLTVANWEEFLAFTNTAPIMDFFDTSVTNLPARYYRAVLQ